MAYQTGQVSSYATIKSTIEDFCVAHGWTLSSNWLSKGHSHVKMTEVSSSLQIIGAVDAVGTSSTNNRSVVFSPSDWPVTYHLFLHTNPDQVVFVLHFNAIYIQTIMFGDLVKVHEDAYVGGNWFFATSAGTQNPVTNGYAGLRSWGDSDSGRHTPQSASSYGHIPFIGVTDVTQVNSCGVHAEVDGYTWLGYSPGVCPQLDSTTARLTYCSVSQWNSQTLLVPIWIHYLTAAGLKMQLGHVEHIRLLRITNYQINDTITIGSDRWRVYPWFKKDTTYPSGTGTLSNHSGTIGFAVRYDGP